MTQHIDMIPRINPDSFQEIMQESILLSTGMSGSLLGRGRGGRLALYGGCSVVILLLFLLYRAATSEMTRLRELHEQCAHQQEALAAQLQGKRDITLVCA